jgi:hypothetical protein
MKPKLIKIQFILRNNHKKYKLKKQQIIKILRKIVLINQEILSLFKRK